MADPKNENPGSEHAPRPPGGAAGRPKRDPRDRGTRDRAIRDPAGGYGNASGIEDVDAWHHDQTPWR
ncbi:MAG TPA: hypothetical protein VK943_06000 [Arenibaculum sp.]|nr:hypothetical protein [Arenibaculum sp.]